MSVMGKGTLPSLKNPVLEALYRRIRDLEESLPRVGVAGSAGPAGRDAPPRAAATPRALTSCTCAGEDARLVSPRSAGPFENRLRQPVRAAAKTVT